MCFAIPLRVKTVQKKWVILENGNKLKLHKSYNLHNGDYVRISGNLIVDILSKKEGVDIRKLIKKIYQN